MEYSSILKRFIAYCIDSLIILIPFYCMLFGMIIFFILTANNNEPSGIGIFAFVCTLIFSIVYLVFSFVLWAWMTANPKYMGTPGKLVVGIKVVSEDGKALTFGQAIVREAIKSFFSPYVILTAFFSDKKQGIHDILVKSVVIDK